MSTNAEYQPKFTFQIETENFLIKVAETEKDIKKAQKLRHEIFLEEGLGRSHETGLDFDDYDQVADHLMIIDKRSNNAVGTYRLINSQFSNIFYSQNEFHLDDFLKTPGAKLEMGRACTHSQYRNGHTMDLLWQGLSKYITISKTRYLFGCSSVNTTNPKVMFSLLKSLHQKEQLKMQHSIYPIGKYKWPDDVNLFKKAEPLPGYVKELPPLLRSYLHAGSNVYGMPAFDEDFACFDLFTILDLTKLNKKFQARYNVMSGD